MFDLIKRFFMFLLPIIRSAVIEVAVDELTKAAYPSPQRRRRSYAPYNRIGGFSQPPTPDPFDWDRRASARNTFEDPEQAEAQRRFEKDHGSDEPFHDVLLVAFDLRGKCPKAVHEWLHAQMPEAGNHEDAFGGKINLDSWWVANDERFNGSDCDSAVFVHMGDQEEARNLLRHHGLGN